MKNGRKPRDLFSVCSWVFLLMTFCGLLVYMSMHIQDLLDSDMASELLLARQLKDTGGILSDQWYYSTEIRILNTQLFYSLFFRVFDDWQTVRIFANASLYLVLLASYFFLCKRLQIERYFPITAGFMLLPLSSPYFYILLYGAFYLPRISLMFLIIGFIIPTAEGFRPGFKTILPLLILSILSLALGLEGGRMLLVLFVPLSILVAAETFRRLFPRNGALNKRVTNRIGLLAQDGFPQYFTRAFVSCVFAVAGFFFNANVLSSLYPFESNPKLTMGLSLGNITNTAFHQVRCIGNGVSGLVFSLVIWSTAAILFVRYCFRKGERTLSGARFAGFCFVSWACYVAFSCCIFFGQVAWHMVPVTILFIPGTVIVLKESKLSCRFRRGLSIGLILCLLVVGIPGYAQFGNWQARKNERCNAEFQQIAAVLTDSHYTNGYATFWNANILTELSDGEIEVWVVNAFDETTPESPDLYQWLQSKRHDSTLPSGNCFLVWSVKEYNAYKEMDFDYLGKVIFRSDDFIVFEVKM